MAKKADSLTKHVQPELNLPAYMKDAKPEGLEHVKDYITPPRLKIIQKQADDELLERFNTGDVVIMPAQALVAQYDKENPDKFHFVPLFFYPEWCTWSPYEMRGKLPMILERTLDPKSELARKAKAPKLRQESMQYEGQDIMARHVEHLNFIISLYGHPLGVDNMILSFQKGDHGAGIRFNSLIKMRDASIYGAVYEAVVSKRPGAKGEWMGINISNPTVEGVSPWVTEEEYAILKTKHKELAESYKKGLLLADYEDQSVPEETGETDGEF